MMRIKKGVMKAWSTWGIGALALVELLRQQWPAFQSVLPPAVHEHGLVVLIALVGVLRLIDQGLDHYETGENDGL